MQIQTSAFGEIRRVSTDNRGPKYHIVLLFYAKI
jgi:hypothetical protein